MEIVSDQEVRVYAAKLAKEIDDGDGPSFVLWNSENKIQVVMGRALPPEDLPPSMSLEQWRKHLSPAIAAELSKLGWEMKGANRFWREGANKSEQKASAVRTTGVFLRYVSGLPGRSEPTAVYLNVDAAYEGGFRIRNARRLNTEEAQPGAQTLAQIRQVFSADVALPNPSDQDIAAGQRVVGGAVIGGLVFGPLGALAGMLWGADPKKAALPTGQLLVAASIAVGRSKNKTEKVVLSFHGSPEAVVYARMLLTS